MRGLLRAGEMLSGEAFAEVRRRMVLECCKWDPQVGDGGTLAGFPLVMGRQEWEGLCAAAEGLGRETLEMEKLLMGREELWGELGMGRKLRNALRGVEVRDEALRVMRFDFHPTAEGWKVSEVNSDVPGGYAEGSAFARLMAERYEGLVVAGDAGEVLVGKILEMSDGPVVLVAAAGFMEDQQVVGYLGKVLERRFEISDLKRKVILAGVGQLRFLEGEAFMESEWYRGRVGVIVRFYQGEWLPRVKMKGLVGTKTPMVNGMSAVLSESKRMPLVWGRLGVKAEGWRNYLPETREPREVDWFHDDRWLVKSAYCNTGDTVMIRERMTKRKWWGVRAEVMMNPRGWVAQRRFEVVGVKTPMGVMYPCVGVYVVGGKACGAYVRMSPGKVVDYAAVDVALLIEEMG